MDYCYQCRRHLNGALACAGCGTPAEELRHHSPVSTGDDVVIELGGAHGEDRPPAGHRRAPASGRRDRRAGARRARRRRGRKVLLGTVGLALAAGALSLAELARESSGDDGTAVEVREEESIAVDDIPEPTGSAEPPPGPSAVSEAPTTSSGEPARPSTPVVRGSARRGVAASSSQAEPSVSSSAAPEPSSDVSPSGTAGPSQPASSTPPGQPGPPPQPAPTPSPTETCTWFLFWCT
ncbi:SCO2400 family protein [Streptomyces sp. NPDC054841]